MRRALLAWMRMQLVTRAIIWRLMLLNKFGTKFARGFKVLRLVTERWGRVTRAFVLLIFSTLLLNLRGLIM